MKVIVGLGNIGKQYEKTRHNAGFIAIDLLLEKYSYSLVKQEFDSLIYTTMINNQKVLLVKPLTYMNNSGIAVRQILNFYKIDLNDLIIIHDDKDLNISRIQFKKDGSAAGHNGIKSIINNLNTQSFYRLRIGVNQVPKEWKIVDWVLSKFSDEELNLLKQTFINKIDFINDFTNNKSFIYLMNKYN
ncbi:aminoacyl-tRNA hydrolase [Mycoplasma feriruminatoris]|uniref:aminoacyl-tRNA hydrolase n=1 Tax=Mycoplasma feriruminatoris TaxID=1179777 RepID=UPI00241CB423|nr:aminoacyl-tRNA hydrolase [Mycoplasma feriruminatoris]WFQ90534.1 Peptidyl-tRNA hydrolase [Mycoplasma feriruminatoris]